MTFATVANGGGGRRGRTRCRENVRAPQGFVTEERRHAAWRAPCVWRRPSESEVKKRWAEEKKMKDRREKGTGQVGGMFRKWGEAEWGRALSAEVWGVEGRLCVGVSVISALV